MIAELGMIEDSDRRLIFEAIVENEVGVYVIVSTKAFGDLFSCSRSIPNAKVVDSHLWPKGTSGSQIEIARTIQDRLICATRGEEFTIYKEAEQSCIVVEGEGEVVPLSKVRYKVPFQPDRFFGSCLR